MRKTFKKTLSLILAVIMVITIMPTFALSVNADENERFLMAYFTGNLQSEQQIRFAVSTDGANFKPLYGGNAVLQEKSTDTQSYDGYTNTDGVRDPYIFDGHDGYYYCIATDLEATAYGFWGNQSQMVLWRSADLINWSDPYYINVAQICNSKRGTSFANSDFQRTWAPEVFYEDGQYMIYFALAGGDYQATRMHYMITDDLMDWTHYSAPQVLYDPGYDDIDADIIKEGNTYYMFYKDETPGRSTVCLATAESLTGPYTYQGQFETSSATGGIEGCEVYTVGNNYYLVADRFGAAGNFAIYNMGSSLAAVAAAVDNDKISVTDGNPISTVEELYGFTNLTPRHGAIMHISQAQYDALVAASGGVTDDDIMYNFTTAYSNTSSGWQYYTYSDSSLHSIDIMFKENGSSAKVAHDSGYITLNKATLFVNDAAVRSMLPDDVSTVSFDYSLLSEDNLNAPIFALGTGSGAPSVNTDYVMIFGNGDCWVRKTGESSDTLVGNAALTLGVTYHYDIVSDGTNITFYRDGIKICSIETTVDFPDSGTRYAAFGYTDGHSSASYGCGTYSHIRFRDSAVSADTLQREFNDKLIYRNNNGTATVNDKSGALEVSNANGSNLVEPMASYNAASYTLAGWVNPGDSVNYNTIMGIGNNKWTPSPYGRYFAVTEDGQIRFNYCSGSNSGGNWSQHYIDISNVFTLTANTWSYLQINIVPISDNQVKLTVWKDGAQTYQNDITLTTKVDDNDTTGNDYAYGMLGFMQQPTNKMFLGDMGTPNWFHTANDTSYVKDVRFYAQAMDPAILYTTQIAREVVEADYGKLDDVPTFNVQPYHRNDGVPSSITAYNERTQQNETYSNVYSNIVYSPQNTTSWSGNGSGDVATGVGRTNFKVAIPLNTVLVYDGIHDVVTPVMIESACNDTNGSSHIIHYVRINSSNCFELRHDWYGYGTDWQQWASKNISTADQFSYRDKDNEKESDDSQRDSASRFWWNSLYYTGYGNTSTYYDVDTNISFYAQTSYKSNGRQYKTGSFTSVSNNYVINYEPVYDIVDGTTKVPNTEMTAYDYYNDVVKGNEWMYTEESLDQYYLAMYYVINSDPNGYNYTGQVASDVAACASNIKNAVAEFDKINLVKKEFFVEFVDEDGTELQSGNVYAGDTPAYTGATPTKEATTQYTYTFNGWSPAIAMATEDATYTATYNSTVNEYTITFVDEDGTELQSSEVAYGTVPTAPADPTKAATDQYTYTFAGWDNEIVAVTGPATYTATYNSTVNEYTITFVDEDGTELQSSEVAYGTVPTAPADPTKESTAQYTYTFAGWDSEIVAVTGPATYTATYNSTINKYLITFNNYDDSELQSSEVEYGTAPTYTGETPVKPATAQYTFAFAGWAPDVTQVTGVAVYTAQFTSTVNEYTIKFVNDDGTELQSSDVAYGTIPTYNGETPTKDATAQYTYTFAGWDNEIVAVTGEATYTATYTSTVNKYTVIYNDKTGAEISSADIEYGKSAATEAPELPAAFIDAEGHHSFAWDAEFANVTEAATYSQVETVVPHNYTGDYTSNNDGTHSRKCTLGCEFADTQTCTYEDVHYATSGENNGYTVPRCTVCGYEDMENAVYDATDWSTYTAYLNAIDDILANTVKYSAASLAAYSDATAAIKATVTVGDQTKSQAFIDNKLAALIEQEALLELHAYTVTLIVNTDGVDAEPVEYSVNYGEMKELAYTGTGTVYKWTTNYTGTEKTVNTTSANYSVVVNGDVTYTVFASTENAVAPDETSKISLLKKGDDVSDIAYIANGTNNVSINGNAITIGDVTMTVPELSFYNITGFTVNGEAIGESITIDGDVEIKAVYTAKPAASMTITYTDCFNAADNTSGGPIDSRWDERITVTAEGADKNTEWLINDTVVGYGETFTFRMTQTAEITCRDGEEKAVAVINYMAYDNSKLVTKIVGSYDLPEGATLISCGIVNKNDTTNGATVESNKITYEYLLAAVDTSAKKTANNLTDSQQFVFNISRKTDISFIAGAIAFVTYEIDGVQNTVYSDTVSHLACEKSS